MKLSIFYILIFFVFYTNGQPLYRIDASGTNTAVRSGELRMGNAGPVDKEITVNNKYIAIGGSPVIPVMGEVHYSRVPKAQWEDVILKMKACGINVIATYVFWNHHEEVEGQFDWTGNKDFRAFVKLCMKHHLYVYPRIGPWCHGEVRNGATPDWILQKQYIKDRSNDLIYQYYVDRLYEQIAIQMKGLLYKDGGPIIGVQLENEYRRGKEGEAHIRWLKETAIKKGMSVPMYTVTGWGNASVPALEVVPLWGAYPDEPWASNLKRSTDCDNFVFKSFRNNEKIGNGGEMGTQSYNGNEAYPYLTCEMGVGIENTDHRRLTIGRLDGLGLISAKLGSGSNMIGYYMFAGGTNPKSNITSMEENKEETGYWNTNPELSYDFQAAIRESGQLNSSYFEIKKIHYFLNSFGDKLAPMDAYFATAKDGMQYSFRGNGKSGFLFGINYCRHNSTTDKKKAQFSVKLNNETVLFPSKSITITDSSLFIWPVNFDLDGTILKYATAQPLCTIHQKENDVWVFAQNTKAIPEFCFDAADIKTLISTNGDVKLLKEGKYMVTNLKPGIGCVISILTKNGKTKRVLVLDAQSAQQSWLLGDGLAKQFFISDAGMYLNQNQLHVFGTSPRIRFRQLANASTSFQLGAEQLKGKVNGLFMEYEHIAVAKSLKINFKKQDALENAQWLNSSANDTLAKKNELIHRFFIKEFSLNNTAKIKSAQLMLAAESDCQLQIDNQWVNQPILVGKFNVIDVTGYLQKGENKLLLDFPYRAEKKGFSAKLMVQYANTDQISVTTDGSWLMVDQYNYPSYLTVVKGLKVSQPLPLPKKPIAQSPEIGPSYSISLPDNYMDGLQNVYLNIKYAGDKAKLKFGHQLLADDFNDGEIWSTGLNRLPINLEGQPLTLDISSLSPTAKVYFDDAGAKKKAVKATLENLELVPEYAVDFLVVPTTNK